MVAPSAPAPYPTRRRRVTLPRYQNSTSCLPWSAIMFLLLTGSRGTACAKFVVLIVSVVGAEIELDLGPISYTRQRISQERCRKCPLWVKSRHAHCKRSCLLYPRKQTLVLHKSMSAKGQ